MPFTRHAFEHVHPGIFEGKARPCNKVTKRLRDQDLSWRSKTSNSRAGMHCNPSEIISHDFAFARVQAAAHLKT